MKNHKIALFIKTAIYGFGWLGLATMIGFIISSSTRYNSFQNILFVEGLLLIFIGIFSSISSDSIALSLMGGVRSYRTEINISLALSSFSLIIGGILSTALTFIM